MGFAKSWASVNVNPDILRGLLASKFFWAVNLGGLADTSFSVTGSFDEMMAKQLAEYPYVGAIPQKNGMYGVIDSVAIDLESHGKTILHLAICIWQVLRARGSLYHRPFRLQSMGRRKSWRSSLNLTLTRKARSTASCGQWILAFCIS